VDIDALSERIRERRVALRLTRNQLDARSDLAHSYTSRLERGLIANPGILQLQRIAAALGMKLSQIIAESEERSTSGEGAPEPVLPPLTADLADVASDLLAIQRLDSGRLDIVRRVVADIRGQAETEARRARRINSTSDVQPLQRRPPGRAK
jgi:transcriptional regulator with XRE-family HTH domain